MEESYDHFFHFSRGALTRFPSQNHFFVRKFGRNFVIPDLFSQRYWCSEWAQHYYSSELCLEQNTTAPERTANSVILYWAPYQRTPTKTYSPTVLFWQGEVHPELDMVWVRWNHFFRRAVEEYLFSTFRLNVFWNDRQARRFLNTFLFRSQNQSTTWTGNYRLLCTCQQIDHSGPIYRRLKCGMGFQGGVQLWIHWRILPTL